MWFGLFLSVFGARSRDRRADQFASQSDGAVHSVSPAQRAPDEADYRHLADLFERVNDQVIGEIRGWDTLASAILGGVIAVFVLIVDKAETYWPVLTVLWIPAVLLWVNTSEEVGYAPEPDAFQPAYLVDRLTALEGLVAGHRESIRSNRETLASKERGVRRALILLGLVSLLAVGCKIYTGFQEQINVWIHQEVATWLESRATGKNDDHRTSYVCVRPCQRDRSQAVDLSRWPPDGFRALLTPKDP
jgi:hypothetical protein